MSDPLIVRSVVRADFLIPARRRTTAGIRRPFSAPLMQLEEGRR